MNDQKNPKVFRLPPLLAVTLASVVLVGHGLQAQVPAAGGVASAGLFELGDAHALGTADISPDASQAGPDWQDLFRGDRTLLDSDGNGLPDTIDLGGYDAVFSADNVSGGLLLDFTALNSQGRVYNGIPAAQHDLSNSYVFSTFDSSGNVVLYLGAERVADGDSYLEFEFNQEHVRLGHGPPWEITGEKAVGDFLVRVDFAAGRLSATIQTWGGGSYQTLVELAQEGCDAAETVCIVSNASEVDGGPWPNFTDPIPPRRFVELGVNVGALLASNPQAEFKSIQIRTPEDIAFGYFGEGPWE